LLICIVLYLFQLKLHAKKELIIEVATRGAQITG